MRINFSEFFITHLIVQEHCFKLGKRLIQRFGKLLVRGERHLVIPFDLHGIASGHIDALAGLHWGYLECADSLNLDVFSVNQGLGYSGEQFAQKEFAYTAGGRCGLSHQAGKFNECDFTVHRLSFSALFKFSL